VSAELIGVVTGLALLDSLNPATILGVALILLLPGRDPVPAAVSFVVGAYGTVLVLGVVLLLAAGTAAGAVEGGLVWVRRIAFGLAALMLLRAAVVRLRRSHRRAVALPAWFSPWTALPLGAVVTAADLPNAFPYAIAIERLVSAGVPVPTGLVVLAAYSLVYCLPCLVLLAAGIARGERLRARLAGLHARFGRAADRPRSLPAALGLGLLAAAATGVAVSV
jgi:cytochrome c biogenesis protein CcdA